MGKMKTSKTLLKRVKITAKGKLIRRHQLGAGHLKSNKSKGALERAKKTTGIFKGEIKTLKKMLGI